MAGRRKHTMVLRHMSKEQDESRLLAVPDATLTLVLRHLPLKDRLGSCALSCRALAAIATKATDDITLSDLLPAKHDQLLQWLSSHGRHVTRLSLSSSGGIIRPPPAKMAQLLQACPNLQKLELYAWHVDCAAFDPPSTPSALQQLQLSYCDIAGGQHLAALQRTLQHLELSYNWFSVTAAMQATLSSSLRHLSSLSRLQHLKLHVPAAVSTEFVTALTALTGLSALELHASGSGGTLTSLSSLSQLRHLDLNWRSDVNPAVLLSGLSQLQHLRLSYLAPDPSIPAAAYTGLAAHCSSLTSLDCCVPAAAWGHAFDPARPLPRLQALTLLSFAAGAGGGGNGGQMGLTEQQIAAVVECCPGLQRLILPKDMQQGQRLTPLKRLSGLTSLNIRSISSAAIADIAQLRQLRSLSLDATSIHSSHLSYKDCYPLLGLRGLTNLELLGLDNGLVDWCVNLKDQGGCKVDVWELLLFQLDELERIGPWAYYVDTSRLCGVDLYW